MNAFMKLVFVFAVIGCAGCAHTGKVAASLYVPFRCIQHVSWTKPCNTVSEHLVRCDGVMVTTSCVSAGPEKNGQVEQKSLSPSK
jgi:hypothetical protein